MPVLAGRFLTTGPPSMFLQENFMEHIVTHARSWSKHFICINSFKPGNNPVKYVLLFSSSSNSIPILKMKILKPRKVKILD